MVQERTAGVGSNVCSRPRLFAGLILALTLLNLVPIWAFPFLPTADGPSHLENAYILSHWFEPDRLYHQIYELNPALVPNWTSHFLLAALIQVVPPRLAEKILLTGYVVGFVLAVAYLLRSVGRERIMYLPLAFPFLSSYVLWMGFYNFAFSIPTMLFALGWWWRRRDEPFRWRRAVTLNLLLLLLYFTHLVSLVLTLGALGLLAALHHGRQVRRTFVFGLALLPSAGLTLSWLITHPGPTRTVIREPRLARFLGMDALVAHDPRAGYVGVALLALFVGLLIFTFVREKLAWRDGEPRFTLRDGFLLLAVVFTALYFIVPGCVAGGSFMRKRLAIYPFLVILPWLTVRYPRRIRQAVVLLATTLAVLHVALPLPRLDRQSQGIADYTSALSRVGRDQTILPVNFFSHMGIPGSRIPIYLHAVGYYTAEAGAVGLDNYEAGGNHFPLRYQPDRHVYKKIGLVGSPCGDIWPRKYPLPVDWILVHYPHEWDAISNHVLDRHRLVRWILRYYEAVHNQGEVWLFRRRPEFGWPPRKVVVTGPGPGGSGRSPR